MSDDVGPSAHMDPGRREEREALDAAIAESCWQHEVRGGTVQLQDNDQGLDVDATVATQTAMLEGAFDLTQDEGGSTSDFDFDLIAAVAASRDERTPDTELAVQAALAASMAAPAADDAHPEEEEPEAHGAPHATFGSPGSTMVVDTTMAPTSVSSVNTSPGSMLVSPTTEASDGAAAAAAGRAADPDPAVDSISRALRYDNPSPTPSEADELALENYLADAAAAAAAGTADTTTGSDVSFDESDGDDFDGSGGLDDDGAHSGARGAADTDDGVGGAEESKGMEFIYVGGGGEEVQENDVDMSDGGEGSLDLASGSSATTGHGAGADAAAAYRATARAPTVAWAPRDDTGAAEGASAPVGDDL